MARIGVLAVQGAFALHARALEEVGHAPVLVRAGADFDGLVGIVLPGGESTVQLDLLDRLDLAASLRALVAAGAPVLATCAGLILAAREVRSPEQRSFGFLDVVVERNAWGRQVDSFEAISDGGRPLVFIRAPRIVAVGPRAEVLDRFEGEPILVRDGRVTCATYHPELTSDREVHRQAFAGA